MADPAAKLRALTVERFKTREDWLRARRAPDVIGASEAAMALGVSPYGTPWALYESKRTPKTEPRTEVLQRGHRWESAVLAEYADESGVRLCQPFEGSDMVTLSRPDLPWLRQTPDGFGFDQIGELGQVEAKTALKAHVWSPEPGVVIDRWDDAHADLVPPHYAIQGYVQMIVTGLAWVDLCALVPKGGWLGVRWVRLQRDPETQGQIEAALTEWRQRHLVEGVPPELDGSEPCNRYLARRFPLAEKKPQRFAAPSELAAMLELFELRQRIKADEARCDKLRNALIESAGGHALCVGTFKGPYGQPQNSGGRRTVNMEALRAEAPDLVEKHERVGAPSQSFNLYRFDQVAAAKAALSAEPQQPDGERV